MYKSNLWGITPSSRPECKVTSAVPQPINPSKTSPVPPLAPSPPLTPVVVLVKSHTKLLCGLRSNQGLRSGCLGSWKRQLAADWHRCQHQHRNGSGKLQQGVGQKWWWGRLQQLNLNWLKARWNYTPRMQFWVLFVKVEAQDPLAVSSPCHSIHSVPKPQSDPTSRAGTVLYWAQAALTQVLKH